MILRTMQKLFANHFVWSVVAGAVVVLIVSAANAATHKADMNFTESGTDLDRIYIENINGDIDITGTSGSTVEIKAHIEIEGDLKAIEEYAKVFMPKISRSDGRLVIETEKPDDEDLDDDINNSSISYVISLPKAFGVHTETVNGDVSISKAYGQIIVEVVNGDIELKCDEEDNKGVDIESVNGDVEISLRKLTDDCDYESVNGDFELRIAKAIEGDIDIETVNGDIEIYMPETVSVDIDAVTAMGGDIETDWGEGEGITFLPGEKFAYKVKDGKYKIEIETVNGSIELHHKK